MPVTDDRARDPADRSEDASTLSVGVWSLARDIIRGANKAGSQPEGESGTLDLNADIYASKQTSPASDTGSGAVVAGCEQDGGAKPACEKNQEFEVVVGPAIIESPPRIEVVVGRAIMEPPPRIEVVVGRAIIERGPKFIVDSDRSASYEIVRGNTLGGISRDLLRVRHSGDPDYSPSGAEIARTVREIARQNHIEDPDQIRAGRTLKIRVHEPDNVRGEKGGDVT